MVWLILIALAVTAVTITPRTRTRRHHPRQSAEVGEPSPAELAATDPIAALQRYGVSHDVERRSDQGVDLGALGYRPPSDG